MSYTLYFVVDFGPLDALTLNAKLFDAARPTPAQVGATITTGFYNFGDGSYDYLATIPDDHVGSFVIYDSSNTDRKFRFAINPQEAEYGDIPTSDVIDEIEALGASATINLINVVDGEDVAVYRADTWNFQTTVPLVLTDYEAIAFVVKPSEDYSEDDALLYVRSDTGLVRINGAAPIGGSGAGSLTVDSATEFTILIDITETDVTPGKYYWWLKVFDTTPAPDEGYTRATGVFYVRQYGLRAIA